MKWRGLSKNSESHASEFPVVVLVHHACTTDSRVDVIVIIIPRIWRVNNMTAIRQSVLYTCNSFIKIRIEHDNYNRYLHSTFLEVSQTDSGQQIKTAWQYGRGQDNMANTFTDVSKEINRKYKDNVSNEIVHNAIMTWMTEDCLGSYLTLCMLVCVWIYAKNRVILMHPLQNY